MCFSAMWLGSEPPFSFWDPNIIIISVFAKEVHFSVEDSPRLLPRNPACARLPLFWKPRQGRELATQLWEPGGPAVCLAPTPHPSGVTQS